MITFSGYSYFHLFGPLFHAPIFSLQSLKSSSFINVDTHLFFKGTFSLHPFQLSEYLAISSTFVHIFSIFYLKEQYFSNHGTPRNFVIGACTIFFF